MGIKEPNKAFFIDRGIWLFCSAIEADMDEAGNKAQNADQSAAARYQVLMKFLHPGETTGMYRDPAADGVDSTEENESYFKNAKRKRRT